MKLLRPTHLILQRAPFLGSLALAPLAWLKKLWFTGSRKYWETRYAAGGTSGLGSYGEVAEFKAKVLNDFVKKYNVKTVIEFGCGDGNQLSLSNYPAYIGLDVSCTAIQRCIQRFINDKRKGFFLYDPDCFHDSASLFRADLALSLDVIYHLVEDRKFHQHLQHLFSAAGRYVIIFSSDTDANPFYVAPHVRHRQFSETVRLNFPGWTLIERVPNSLARRGDAIDTAVANFFVYGRTP
jgi:hypothetical protein